MNKKLVLALGIGGLVAIACGPTLQVRTDHDQAANFSDYKTYRLEEGKVLNQDAATPNTLVQDRIDTALKAQLANEGLAQQAQQSDLIVRYAAGAKTVQELQSVGYPMGPYGGIYPADVWTQEVPEGMLVIDLVDAHTDKLVWRAYIRSEGEGFGKTEFIQKAVKKAFEQYPPHA